MNARLATHMPATYHTEDVPCHTEYSAHKCACIEYQCLTLRALAQGQTVDEHQLPNCHSNIPPVVRIRCVCVLVCMRIHVYRTHEYIYFLHARKIESSLG